MYLRIEFRMCEFLVSHSNLFGDHTFSDIILRSLLSDSQRFERPPPLPPVSSKSICPRTVINFTLQVTKPTELKPFLRF